MWAILFYSAVDSSYEMSIIMCTFFCGNGNFYLTKVTAPCDAFTQTASSKCESGSTVDTECWTKSHSFNTPPKAMLSYYIAFVGKVSEQQLLDSFFLIHFFIQIFWHKAQRYLKVSFLLK